MLPDPYYLAKYFHEAFRIHPENLKKRLEWKKKKKPTKILHTQQSATVTTTKQKGKIELFCENDNQTPPEMELPGNASAFALFASIRLAVLDRWMRQATQEYLQSSSCIPLQQQSQQQQFHHQLHGGDNDIDSDTDENNSQTSTYTPIKVSKIVGIGLRSVFELIKESRIQHPNLCTKALTALLDVLQGQPPEGLKTEPNDIIDPLFDLLLDLACMHGPESSVPNDGTHLTAIACACLLSLVVVCGDTGKYLSATAALLMCPRALSIQNIQMPAVLASLQRSVQGVLLGKLIRPDWLTHGVPSNSKIDSFHVKLPLDLHDVLIKLKSLACDGQYLYLFTSNGLLKIGTGFGGTLKGHVYFWKPDFYPLDNGSLVYCAGNLYLKLCGRRGGEFLIVERSNLLISGTVPLHCRDESASVVFSDGDNLGTISPARDDGFVVRILNQTTVPASLINELPLKLARKCVDVFGISSSCDDEISYQTINTANDDEVATICAGKDFALIKTTTGKVLYSGKATSLGIKQAGVRTGKWSELVLTKAPKVTHIAVGHEGLHAILLTEDGSVFFAGTARRGEDGDQSKVRRQPKPIKPKKMIKVDGQFVVSAACNNGTTAIVTRDGELLMFGKDTTHTDPTTGLVCNLKGEFITQVALGKAHAVALTTKGQIYTFGINNKYQCGRDFVSTNRDGSTSAVVAMDTTTCANQEDHDFYEDYDENRKDCENIAGSSDGNSIESQPNICPAGMHSWHDNVCMICTVCRECTGYSISCLSSMSTERNPGQECGCGEGDSGCSICGCCRICAREVIDNSELADLAGIMKLDLILRDKTLIPPKQRTKLQEQIHNRLEERKSRTRKSSASGSSSSKQSTKLKSIRPAVTATPTHRSNNTVRQQNNAIVKDQGTGSDVERDATRITSLPPAKLHLPSDSPVVQIACGLHHTVLLLQNGQVYTFGSNLYGQLGCGDILAKANIQHVKLPCNATHIAAGSNHTVILTVKGEVYTFGNNQKGQLGRNPPSSPQQQQQSQNHPQPGQSSSNGGGSTSSSGNSTSNRYNNPRTPWYCIPAPIPNIGPKHGRRATWVGASGDQTFLKIDESLINSISISKSTITANKNSIILLPNHEETARNFKCLVINKRDGNCNSFKNDEQVDFVNKTVCMDPIYNVLWSYNSINHEIICYNIIVTELQTKKAIRTLDNKFLFEIKTMNDKNNEINVNNFDLTSILSPELSLPVLTNCHVTRFQAAINLLCCLDTLTIANDLQLTTIKEEIDDRQVITGKQYSKEDFQCVNRFENHGGGWGYSGHSIEAIRFMADTDILLGGFGLFGGRGEYTAKLKLLDIGPDGGEQEGDGELLAETEEVPYECGPRQKYPLLFDEPVPLQAHRWYVAWCRISGPSSDCGSSGQTMVTTEDQVLFYFKSSKKSNNGTDVNAGQIPQLLYKIITQENQTPTRQLDIIEPVHVLTKDFSRTVTKECFQSLLSLLQWSWNTFKWAVMEGQSIKNMYTNLELERLVYINRASLRLIYTYTNEIYPNRITKKIPLENVHLAECIGDVRTLLRQILSDNLPVLLQNKKSTKTTTNRATNPNILMMNSILDECHNTFVACFHAFYPTAYLKWICLCDLLTEIDKETTRSSSHNSQRLLSAVLCALCAPSIRLRSTFPLLTNTIASDNSLHRGLSPSDNTGLPIMSASDSHYYPVLVEQMSYKSQIDSYSGQMWQWNDVLEHLLQLVSEPINQNLKINKTVSILPDLTRNCCHLLARVVAELVHQCSTSEEDIQNACGRILHMTTSRFTRTNQSRTWNTGNGSPDAICFQVDRPGISIAGCGVYSGVGHYEYELELLEDQSSLNGTDSHTHTQRWNSLEITRGSFVPEDLAPDIIEIKFDRVVPIKENVKYAIRLRNHGGRTNNGDGGLNSVKGSDNTTFTFSTCSLSFNGTTLTRGQIPIILYYSNPVECGRSSATKLEQQSRKAALSMASTIIHSACNLMVMAREKADEVPSISEILNNSYMVTTLLPLVLAHISPLATSDSRSAVHILNLIHEILPHVSALNLMDNSTLAITTTTTSLSNQDCNDNKVNTTSQHYTWVQSDHPYKPATVSNYRVIFPNNVKWMTIEFDPACATAQPEDSLQLYIPSIDDNNSIDIDIDTESPPLPYWPVLHKFTSCMQWPTSSIVLPGNEVIFSLETASDYLKDDRSSSYGFKCLVVGYEWPPNGNIITGLKHLEAELAFLGGMCSASLMKKDLQLPINGDENDIDIEMAETIALQTFAQHGALLSKGLALSSPPTVNQALDGMLPYSVHSNERLFLRDFVSCVAGSSGGRLAQWLQPGSRVDPSKCQVLYSREELRCGWPAIITVLTRDQYSELVTVPNMKVEVKAIPIDKKELGECDTGRKIPRVIQPPDPLTFGGLPPPPLHHYYEPTIRDKMCFHSISVMKTYQNYSFEELRYASPPVKRSSENMLIRYNTDGTYSATWTPGSIGFYSIVVTIDGYDMEEVFKVEVKEPPQGMTPPSQITTKKSIYQPSKLRKFVANNSAGLRIRAHPSLQSEQIGIVHVNGTIAFIDEIHNDDGVWLRLSADTIKQYCNTSAMEAWCLQYNQHLGKTLLLPVEEPKSILDHVINDALIRKSPEIRDRRKTVTISNYQVIKCGASGHNIRSRPSLKANPIGMLVLGNRIGVIDYTVNADGYWVLLDKPTQEKYCFETDSEEAWSLAIGPNNVLYLGNVNGNNLPTIDSEIVQQQNKKGFDFSLNQSPNIPEPNFSFTTNQSQQQQQQSPMIQSKSENVSTNPFVFGHSNSNSKSESPKLPKREKRDPKLSNLPKWFKANDTSEPGIKDYGGSNGNGVTPPSTPKRSQSPRGGGSSSGHLLSQKPSSRSSSPVPIPPRNLPAHDSTSSTSPQAFGSPRSIGISPLARRGSNQSDTSALVSSITHDLSQSASQATQPHDLSPSPSGSSSLHTRSESSPPPYNTPLKREISDSEQSPKKLTQTGTQTSPESNNTPSLLKGHFSIGTSGTTSKEEKLTQKLNRIDRATGKTRPKRAISPATLQQLPTSSKINYQITEPAKQAMSPSVAEALRAVFAAFLWHEGIVHDAMACASFLKFHPTLPKQGAQVVTRQQQSQQQQQDAVVDKRRNELSREERIRQRHSVEVSNAGNYLHIQPSTLESLTRSAANASANRKRIGKHPNIINEESGSSGSGGGDGNYSYQTISVLPPALKSLVYLWEELTTNCLHAIMQQMVVVSPSHNKTKKCEKIGLNSIKNDIKDKNTTIDAKDNNKKSRKKKILPRNYLEDIGLSSYLQTSSTSNNTAETLCELCGETFPHPVTYHMHQSHPGCGQHAGGKGYNSGGNYCLGWAGNCGDGGVPNSSWYLLCENCREKYIKTNRTSGNSGAANNIANNTKQQQIKNLIKQKSYNTKQLTSPSTTPGLEPHIIMKNNAMFLLDLASSNNHHHQQQQQQHLHQQRRPSSSLMPSVSENNSPPSDYSGPFSPLPPFQCLQALGANSQEDNESEFYEKVLREENFHEITTVSGQRPLSEISASDNDSDSNKGMRFHRSVSMGTNGIPWSKTGLDGRIIMLRKRNNSSSEIMNESGSSLLCNPSTALQKLIPKMDTSSSIVKTETDHNDGIALLQRPVMQFLLQQHDLESLQLVMRQALRKAMCRVYAMQALNWLLKSVTQPICLHDLLWWFVTSLTPIDIEQETDDDNRPIKKLDDIDMNVCEHPLSDITIAGDSVYPLPNTFHSLLQTIADLMVLLPIGSPLQQMAVRCWGLRFTSNDHTFLHRSQVFNNISKILSRSEEMEDCTVSMHESNSHHHHHHHHHYHHHHHHYNQLKQTTSVEYLKDFTQFVEIKASSRQAMIGSLTDGSTETFWESGDEDRNKTKSLTLICQQNHHPYMICVHIDNCRDLGNKVSNITFYSGLNTDELNKLRVIEVEQRLLGGWINCPIPSEHNNDSIIRLELKGPDVSVRVRQIRVLGSIDGESLKIGKQYNSLTIQQRNCETETLRVFRLITSQVFGKLLHGGGSGGGNSEDAPNNLNESGGTLSGSESLEQLEDNNDLKEHMVGILFSRSKLTHLQKQVIVHIVQAIRKETERVRDEWEASLTSTSSSTNTLTNSNNSQENNINNNNNNNNTTNMKNTDTYCFEMLSMVLALSGSTVGRTYLSHQDGLLNDLLSLLHTGSARVQRQVTSLLRRILPEITPATFAKIVGIKDLPPKDFNIVTTTYNNKNKSNEQQQQQRFDVNKVGILDVFLSVIAKALTVQVKMKSNKSNSGGNAAKEINTITLSTSISPKDNLGERWYLKGCINRKLADVIINLIKDMSSGKFSDLWANITKGAIAENILHLTQLNDEQRLPTICLKTPTLWLALASLCVLDKDHVERLSSGQWNNHQHNSDGQQLLPPPRPTCTNHDDGETNAIIQCNICGNLCGDCDRFLHLHRKTRNHQRQVCKEEEEAIKVELHEGCGRTKLFWLLALADSRTLKALIEYRDGGNSSNRTKSTGISGVCRFCGTTSNSGLLAIGNVCADYECQEYGKTACPKLLNCGHMCGGILNEQQCLPCLHGCTNDTTLKQDADDMCMICFTEALSAAPAIQLKCGHVFHLHCCKTVLMKRWAGPRITFSFSLCPICKEDMFHPVLEELLTPIRELYKDVKRKALMRLEYEGLHTVDAIITPGARFYNDPASYAMDRYAYYVCYKCNKAYYGGEARCDAEIGGENYDPTELVCGGCSDVARAQMCPKHGTDFLEYKCRYCCSVAVFFCFGTTHFCNPCHDDFQRVTNLPKNELPNCPAGPKAKQLDGDECPLHVKHPPTGEEFALGCGVCRNAHTF